jgi:formate/nitrite transporter FocA (FNT family)
MSDQRRSADDATSKTLPGQPKSVDDPESGTRLSAAEIHDNVLGAAENELERSTPALLWSSLAAGLAIGFSFLMGGFAQTLVPERYAHLAAGAVYPVGFAFIVFAQHELFTENTLEPIIPLLHKRDGYTFARMMRLWGLLLVGNLVGTAVFATVLYRSSIIQSLDIRQHLETIAARATSDGFLLTFERAIVAGWLIALLTWVMASTKESITHLALIWLTTAPIAWLDFRHSIVGSVEAFYRVNSGSAGLGDMLGRFIVPAVIGNAIGGVVLVALLNYGQVHHERASGT